MQEVQEVQDDNLLVVRAQAGSSIAGQRVHAPGKDVVAVGRSIEGAKLSKFATGQCIEAWLLLVRFDPSGSHADIRT